MSGGFGSGHALGPCPCDSGEPYAACCRRFIEHAEAPPTAEALMRSRYTAYASGDAEHLYRTWHPLTRPEAVTPDPGVRWTRLEVLDVARGGPTHIDGEVEFVAYWSSADGGQRGSLHERSRFERRGGRWVYVDGDVV